MNHTKVAIIGSGPAGYTAAIYAARANLSPVLFQGDMAGGQLTTTTDVENFPGFPTGIMGPELMTKMEEQAAKFGCTLKNELVTGISHSDSPFKITTSSGTTTAESLIIATGASPKYLGLASEKELLGYGVSSCATCDGAFFKNKEVAVIGGGDSACEEANFLTRFASKVYIVHRRDTLRASKIMQDRVLKNPKVSPLWNKTILEVVGSKASGVTGIKLQDTVTSVESLLPCSAMFLAIGHTPNSALFTGWIKLDDAGYIATVPGTARTNITGVFACGDVQDHVFRQAITAAGTGCMAAIEAERWLETKDL